MSAPDSAQSAYWFLALYDHTPSLRSNALVRELHELLVTKDLESAIRGVVHATA